MTTRDWERQLNNRPNHFAVDELGRTSLFAAVRSGDKKR